MADTNMLASLAPYANEIAILKVLAQAAYNMIEPARHKKIELFPMVNRACKELHQMEKRLKDNLPRDARSARKFFTLLDTALISVVHISTYIIRNFCQPTSGVSFDDDENKFFNTLYATLKDVLNVLEVESGPADSTS